MGKAANTNPSLWFDWHGGLNPQSTTFGASNHYTTDAIGAQRIYNPIKSLTEILLKVALNAIKQTYKSQWDN